MKLKKINKKGKKSKILETQYYSIENKNIVINVP